MPLFLPSTSSPGSGIVATERSSPCSEHASKSTAKPRQSSTRAWPSISTSAPTRSIFYTPSAPSIGPILNPCTSSSSVLPESQSGKNLYMYSSMKWRHCVNCVSCGRIRFMAQARIHDTYVAWRRFAVWRSYLLGDFMRSGGPSIWKRRWDCQSLLMMGEKMDRGRSGLRCWRWIYGMSFKRGRRIFILRMEMGTLWIGGRRECERRRVDESTHEWRIFWWKGNRMIQIVSYFGYMLRWGFDDWTGACIQAELRLGWAFKAALDRVCNIGPEFSYQPLARPVHSSS